VFGGTHVDYHDAIFSCRSDQQEGIQRQTDGGLQEEVNMILFFLSHDIDVSTRQQPVCRTIWNDLRQLLNSVKYNIISANQKVKFLCVAGIKNVFLQNHKNPELSVGSLLYMEKSIKCCPWKVSCDCDSVSSF